MKRSSDEGENAQCQQHSSEFGTSMSDPGDAKGHAHQAIDQGGPPMPLLQKLLHAIRTIEQPRWHAAALEFKRPPMKDVRIELCYIMHAYGALCRGP